MSRQSSNRSDKPQMFNVLDLLATFNHQLKSGQVSFCNNDDTDARERVVTALKALRAEIQKAHRKAHAKKWAKVDVSEKLDWHEANQKGVALWKELVSAALRDIDPNSKGNSKLFEFLKDATEFEDILYGLEPYYRDHTLHSLWVYLIGVHLMRRGKGELHDVAEEMNWYVFNDIQKDKEDYRYPKYLVEWSVHKKKELCRRAQLRRDAIWCIIALCHDLGYSLAKLDGLNGKVRSVLEHFHFSDSKRVGYDLNVEHQYLVNQFLELDVPPVVVPPTMLVPHAQPWPGGEA